MALHWEAVMLDCTIDAERAQLPEIVCFDSRPALEIVFEVCTLLYDLLYLWPAEIAPSLEILQLWNHLFQDGSNSVCHGVL